MEQLNNFYYAKGNTCHENAEENEHNNKSTQILKTPRYVSMMNSYIYTIELSVSEHLRPEVKVTKKTEIKNLQDYETFLEVKDEGQVKVGSCWVITEKEQHDGQKTKVKARLVAQGFQETLKPLSDSPTAARVL